MGDSPAQLVEHFFRHEYAHLVAVLTRAYGVRRMELVEDVVQASIVQAMTSWRHDNLPDNPAAWIHRVARNRLHDVLRREQVHQRAIGLAGMTSDDMETLLDDWLDERHLPDSLLRMMFVCANPLLDPSTQIALILKTLCGFSLAEIGRGLMKTPESIKKRIQRGRRLLAEHRVELELPSPQQLQERLEAIHNALYLLFNEGYSTSGGNDPIRDDLCEEAARLCHILCEHESLSTPATRALLALMLFHGARLEARRDAAGHLLLLHEQDRCRWDGRLIKVARDWLSRSRSDTVSRFHLEAGIAWQHCLATDIKQTNWTTIIQLYDRLISLTESPVHRLNRAIAKAEAGDTDAAFAELRQIEGRPELSDYHLVFCVRARLHGQLGQTSAARACYQRALGLAFADHDRAVIRRRLAELDPGEENSSRDT
ncbi:MAG: sigma-70 family RNA polymerase sigma factor [Planctomycetaceae bacterium]|nr:sigma-70 family RNA polymerase sigma factor [Planctomycetaceae bacterium]